jgi:kinesin family protein 2/24
MPSQGLVETHPLEYALKVSYQPLLLRCYLTRALQSRALVEAHIAKHRSSWPDLLNSHANEDLATASIRVFVRLRPLHSSETAGGAYAITAVQRPKFVHLTHPTLTWSGGRFTTRTFGTDGVFNGEDGNARVCEVMQIPETVSKCIEEGKDACVLAYGQTGAGKTYTTTYLEGTPITIHQCLFSHSVNNTERVCQSIFEHSVDGLSVSISAFEIRGSRAFDLLSDPPFHPVTIAATTASSSYRGLSSHPALTAKAASDLVKQAAELRMTRSTAKNDTSSR